MNIESQSRLAQVRALATDMLIAADGRDTARVLDIADELELLLGSIRMDWRADQELLTPSA